MHSDPPALAAIRAGDRRALARAITLIESRRDSDRKAARELLDAASAYAGSAVRIGITGPPGVGKSTLIEALGNVIVDSGKQLAVLAVDPSSVRSGGSILGDKTRMPTLTRRDEVFVRACPSGGSLGGIARRTREAMVLCEAFGADVVIVETVGVGQSEVAVASITDIFVVLASPGGGDDLQGIKRGVMEHADLVCVTKASGDLARDASRVATDHKAALGLFPPRDGRPAPSVTMVSALEGEGIEELWQIILSIAATLKETGEFERARGRQGVDALWGEVRETLMGLITSGAHASLVQAAERGVLNGQVDPSVAATDIVEAIVARSRS